MTRRQFGWRALLPTLGLGTCVAGAAFDAARAQSLIPSGPEGLVYDKLLDLSLNPARTDVATPPPPEHEPAFNEKAVSLEALVPNDDGRGAPRTRIVHGFKADRGEWPSAVSIRIDKEGKPPGACGATVIGSSWVLTAAHCVFTTDDGGLRSLRAVTAHAKSNLRLEGGEELRIKRAVVYPEFGRTPGFLNDIALLELERPTDTPRQKLTAHAGQSTFLAPGTTATVIGWGYTRPRLRKEKPDSSFLSKDLLKATVPIADQKACAGFLRREVGREMAAAEFCAGDGKGTADACNGDSGGPLFVAGAAGEALQTGIVSWGPGCAQPDTYGVYAAVGYFEQWIRKRVPDVEFVVPRPVAPALTEIAGHKPGAPAAPLGQVTVDLAVHDCPSPNSPFKVKAIKAANRIKVGSCITVHVTSGINGHLGVFNTNAKGTTMQIFPNVFTGSQVGQAPTKVRAGQVIKVPGPTDPDFEIGRPLGPNELIAIVVPEGAGLAETTKRFMDMRPIENFENELRSIARQVKLVPKGPRAVGSRQFEVVE